MNGFWIGLGLFFVGLGLVDAGQYIGSGIREGLRRAALIKEGRV